jgi:dihydroorotate dehydrogenase electron transfer subunit
VPVRAQIAFNRSVSSTYRHLGVAAPGFSRTLSPGQFVMVRPPFVADPLLPRAFSIYRVSQEAGGAPVVEILYKVLGKGTQYLAQMDPGQAVEILGPLGNRFTVPETVGTAVLVAGGIGVPPIAALAMEIVRAQGLGVRDSLPAPHPSLLTPHLEVFLGGKTADDILCVEDFETVGAALHITTEDGSKGTRGLITDLLDPFLESLGDPATRHLGNQEGPSRPAAQPPSRLAIFTCGPPGMLAAVARLAEGRGVPCQTSVEANMACGFGACMGCAIEVRSNGPGPAYKLVCKDGPVFDSRDLVWR